MRQYMDNPDGAVLAMVSFGGNLDTAAHLIGIMLDTLQ